MTNPVTLPAFEQYLALLPPEVFFRYALSESDGKRKILSSSLIKDAAKHLSSEKSLATRFERLSHESKVMCSLAYLFGKRGVPAPAVHNFDDELLSSFLVFAGRDAIGKTFYYPFEEFEHRLFPFCAEVLVETSKTRAPAESASMPHWYCLSDIVVCANLASLGMLEKTKKGTLSKAAEGALKKFLHAPHELPQVEGRETAFDACVSLLLDYAVSRELLVIDGGAYRADPGRMLEWLALPLDNRYADFRGFAFDAVPLWSRAALEKLFAAPARTWLLTNALPDHARADAVIAVSLLRYCGCCDAVKAETGLAFSLSGRGGAVPAVTPQAGRIVLMPDFSAVLPQEVSPEDLFWFLRAGALVSFDRVYKGVIRRDVINGSLSEGADEKKTVAWLVSHGAPHNVAETVKEWIREFSRIYLTTSASVVSFDEKATRQLTAYEPLRNLVTPAQPHSVFMIRRGREEEVRRLLVEMGFDPRAPGERQVEKRRAGIEIAPEPAPAIVPMVSFEQQAAEPPRPVRAGKYGERLKELDMGDMLHVVDYAVIMGKALAVDYLGSPGIKKGMHIVSPLSLYKEGEPYFEAGTTSGKSKRKFMLKKIKRIGVDSA